MNASIEKSGPTVDRAIESALNELGLTRDEVQVDILQLESSGVFGLFGRKEGRVRVTPLKGKGAKAVATAPRPPAPSFGEKKEKSSQRRGERPAEKPQDRAAGRSSGRQQKSEAKAEPKPERKPEPRPERRPEPRPERRPERSAEAAFEDHPIAKKEPIPDGQVGPYATEVLSKITSCFGIDVEVRGTEGDNQVNLRVMGDGVGQLIGRRGKTLGAVQYMVSRLINEDRGSKKKVVIDVDGYNEDREASLKELAERTCEKVLRNGKPAVLRPMSPQERRVVHLTLQDHEQVATESFGDEGARTVVVYPRSIDKSELRRLIDSEGGGRRRSGGPRGRRRGGGGRSRGRGDRDRSARDN